MLFVGCVGRLILNDSFVVSTWVVRLIVAPSSFCEQAKEHLSRSQSASLGCTSVNVMIGDVLFYTLQKGFLFCTFVLLVELIKFRHEHLAEVMK
jgi:hypothetical protein